MVKNDFASLLSLILSVRIGYLRINDVALDDEVYSIDFWDSTDRKGNIEVLPCFKSSKKKEYSLSVKQLAALRVANGPISATYLDEYKDDANGTNFQTKLPELSDKGISIQSLKFKVAKQLRVKNTQITDKLVPVYKDFCYEGSLAYTKSVRALTQGKEPAFFGTSEYFVAMAEIRDTLHATALRAGKATDDNLVLLPVFTIL